MFFYFLIWSPSWHKLISISALSSCAANIYIKIREILLRAMLGAAHIVALQYAKY
jgi:hypothetical protein